MHDVVFHTEHLKCCGIKDWFQLGTEELSLIGKTLLGCDTASCKIRTGTEILPAGKEVIGVKAEFISQEMQRLKEQVYEIVKEKNDEALIRAIAFFHLRFEAIHPLTDGNGRVGRAVLAAQCSQHFAVSVEQIMHGLLDNQHFYMSVFLTQIEDKVRYELFLDIMARILICAPVADLTPPFDFPPRDTVRIGGRFRFVPENLPAPIGRA